jgi:hypothetical protein
MLTWSVVAFVGVALAGQPPTLATPSCRGGSPRLLTYWYQSAVSEHIVPPRWSASIISISLSVTGQPKLILTTDGTSFALLKAVPREDVRRFLGDLDAVCQLPANPFEAARLVPVSWERADLSRAEFDDLHSEFTQAMSAYLAEAQARYRSRLADRTLVLTLHAPEYSVVYDNRSEHIVASKIDDTEDRAKKDPLVQWGDSVLALAAAKLPRGTASPSPKP